MDLNLNQYYFIRSNIALVMLGGIYHFLLEYKKFEIIVS